ncbi:MAG: PTS lactose/cellobiose transporter subunit IIA [Coriobacteriaceae bacterium]|nr:PTS lactose/cellobiose transporter subunit IIA [Coriobacteriaceae bacterium]
MLEEKENPMLGMSEAEKTEYIVEQAMGIIMASGDARTLAAQARDAIAESRFDDARDLLKRAGKTQVEAHNIQTAMIQGDIRGGDEKLGYHVLFAHAQDTLMTIQVEINLTKSMLRQAETYEIRLKALEDKLGN